MTSILYVCSETETFQKSNHLNGLAEFQSYYVNSIHDVFDKISDKSCQIDIIVFDVLHLQECDINVTRLVDAIQFMIKTNKLEHQSNIKIMLAVNLLTDIDLIKEICAIGVGFFPTHLNFSREEALQSVIDTLGGKVHIPKKIKALIQYKNDVCEYNEKVIFTNRQQQILSMIQDNGASNKVIARVLDISESAVKMHIGKILQKTGLKNRTQLALYDKDA
jgi:DNA-binding NarL/FixJ family response regulator